MGETRQRILDTARVLFNAQGVHRVGVREVARALGMSPGNLAYHFPTKDELVAALLLELHHRVSRTLIEPLPAKIPLESFYRTAVLAMRSTLVYRFVMLCNADIGVGPASSPDYQRVVTELRERRQARDRRLLAGLVASGHLDGDKLTGAPHLLEQAELISSGWLAMAQRRGWHDDEAVVLHYAKVGTALLWPYCTPAGATAMHRILEGALDAELSPPPPTA